MNLCRKINSVTGLRTSLVRNLTSNTIYSLSSGYGKCGVAVIRVSGQQTRHALKALVGAKFEPKPRYAQLKSLHYPESKEIIDKGLVLWFPAPASFTGEDACEFQVHGSQAVIAAMLTALGKVPGLRAATPGEFTKRAFYGGKLDLIEVEGLADLIHAETEAQRKQALLQSTGALSRLYDKWRRRLIRCAAHLEAYIDFADDENIEQDVVVQLTKELQRLVVEIRTHLDDQRQGELLRDGVRTVIAGAPNVGKSSLLNMLCQRPVSIVTPLAGTTRDVIESPYNYGGYPVIFSDTAGLRRDTQDAVEVEGIARAKNSLQHADLILLVMDAGQLWEQHIKSSDALAKYIQTYMQELDIDMNNDITTTVNRKLQLVANKIDLLNAEQRDELKNLKGLLCISCKEEINFKEFSNTLTELIKEICGTPSAENPRITHTRYRQQLERCIEHINIFLNEYSPEIYSDMAISAQKLRNAVRCIERITGHVSTDDILDVVFRDFCIGK